MAVYKRGNVWWMSFQFENKHIQKSTKLKNKRDAEAYERAFRTKLAKGEVDLNPEEKKPVPTFMEAVELFLNWSKIEHKTKPKTHLSYESSSKALAVFFRDKLLDKFEMGDFERFKQWRGEQKRRPRTQKKLVKKINKSAYQLKNVRPATINRELAFAKILFNHFIKDNLLTKNPVKGVKFLKEDNEQMRVLTDEEEKLYLMAASQPLQDFATIMLETGMRFEEVTKIDRKNVNLDKRYYFNPFGKTKAAKRKIPLTERAFNVLEKRIRNSESNYLFANEVTGKPITTLKTAHSGAIKRSGVSHFRLYDCRHTFATRFVESGNDLATLMALLGHSNIQMVMRYAHPTEKHQFDSMKRMESVRSAM